MRPGRVAHAYDHSAAPAKWLGASVFRALCGRWLAPERFEGHRVCRKCEARQSAGVDGGGQ